MANTFSNTPWGNFKASDYTPEQWMAACLVVRNGGGDVTKAQCLLPIREPNGTVNKNALSAAAGALAGARGGVNLTPDERSKALASLRRLYAEANMVAPPSLKQDDLLGKFLSHFGVKGMRWGFRRTDAQLASAAKARADIPDAERAKKTLATIRSHGSLDSVSNDDLNHLVNRLNLEKRYADINPSSFSKGHDFVKTLIKVGGTANKAIDLARSPVGMLLFPTGHGGSRARTGGKHLAKP